MRDIADKCNNRVLTAIYNQTKYQAVPEPNQIKAQTQVGRTPGGKGNYAGLASEPYRVTVGTVPCLGKVTAGIGSIRSTVRTRDVGQISDILSYKAYRCSVLNQGSSVVPRTPICL